MIKIKTLETIIVNDTDLIVDFQKPLDYIEPKPPSPKIKKSSIYLPGFICKSLLDVIIKKK